MCYAKLSALKYFYCRSNLILIVVFINDLTITLFHALVLYYVFINCSCITVFHAAMPVRPTTYVSCRRYNSKVMACCICTSVTIILLLSLQIKQLVAVSYTYICGSHIMPTASCVRNNTSEVNSDSSLI